MAVCHDHGQQTGKYYSQDYCDDCEVCTTHGKMSNKKSGCDFRLKFRLLVDKKCLFAYVYQGRKSDFCFSPKNTT